MSVEVLAADAGCSSPVMSGQSLKQAQRRELRPRCRYLTVLVIATFCHATRTSAAEGKILQSLISQLLPVFHLLSNQQCRSGLPVVFYAHSKIGPKTMVIMTKRHNAAMTTIRNNCIAKN